MTAKITYNGELRTTCVHVRSGSIIETDAPVDNKGRGERFSPTDLVSVALATCMLTTLGIAGLVHNLEIDGAVCDVTKIMASDPRRISEIVIEISFPNSMPFSEKQKSKIEHIAATCPVLLSLHPEVRKTITYHWPQ
jgi:uncharacterized OsmC-like protein